MIELLIPYEFDTLEYSWVNATIGICTPVDYFVANKLLQHSALFSFLLNSVQFNSSIELLKFKRNSFEL
jgi:hypothetical protein